MRPDTPEEQERKRQELAAMDANTGRFGIEHNNATNLSRAENTRQVPPTPLSDWMDHGAAMAIRDDYYKGCRLL